MATLAIEVEISEGGPVYSEEFEVSDGEELIYDAYMACVPKYFQKLKIFVESRYMNKSEIVTVDFECKLTADSVEVWKHQLENMEGKCHCAYGALMGLINLSETDVNEYVRKNYS